MQELQPVVDEQAKKIGMLMERLETMEAELTILKGGQGNPTCFKDAFLEQNSPNPYSVRTIIRYRIP